MRSPRRPRGRPTLLFKIFVPNAAVLVVAAILLVLSPAQVADEPTAGQLAVLAGGLVALVVINLLLIQRAVDPVRRLAIEIGRIDPARPGQRIDLRGEAETERLVGAFNAMLDRLEAERRRSGRRMISAQERERVRLARDLHDEAGQAATGLLLEIDHAARVAPPEVRERLEAAREAARLLSDELGRIVRRLRPETLDDLGLASALTVLGDRFTDQTGVPVQRSLELPPARLPEDAELALYRVAQESLTNVARHAEAATVAVSVTCSGQEVLLTVSDDGVGIGGAEPGNGVRGMHERAHLVGGWLSIGERAGGGTEVRLTLPLGEPE